MLYKLNKADIELDAFKCQGKQYKNVYWSTCKRDLVVRDRDVWFSVRDKTETEAFPHFHETETFEIVCRDRDVEIETTSLIVMMRMLQLYRYDDDDTVLSIEVV